MEFGKRNTERQGDYSGTVIDHANNPRNLGRLVDAQGVAEITGPCGDTMKMWLKVKEGRVLRATFWTDGCGATLACGSMATEMIIGKTLEEVDNIGQKAIIESLEGLPPENAHCALLASKTLIAAASTCKDRGRTPQKHTY